MTFVEIEAPSSSSKRMALPDMNAEVQNASLATKE
jgi:hypothetical protein